MFKFNKKLGKRIVSAVIAYSVVFGTLVWDPAARKQVVNADATMFDSASAINYATILGGAVDYGIVAETIEQTSHTETTFATNHFIHTSSNIDVDYVTSTALFLIGRTYTPGDDIERYIRFGRTTASAIYFEAPTAVFGNYNPAIQAGKNITNGNFRFEGEYTNTPFIAAENANAYKNVDRLIDRICSQKPAEDVEKGWSYFLNDRAKSPEYVLNANDNPSKYITYDGDAHVYFDLTDPQFNEKVVYINISKDSRLREYLGKSSGFQIKKNESSVVVINIEDDGQDGALNLNKPIVTVDGVSYSGVTATNGGDPVGAAAVQKNFNESIIWNVMEKSPVLLTDMGGAVLAPLAESVSLQGGNSSGWVVTPGKFNMNTEFHFLYSGSSKDSYGQMHFALTKAFTKKYAKHGEVKQDTSVSIPDDSTYKFYFQEYKAPSQLHGDLVTPIGQKQSVYAQTNAAVTFPVLSFYCDNYDRLTEQQRHFYIEKPSSGTASKTYYFKVTEDPSSPVGITNSNGYIDIRLKVQVDSAGKFTYFVDYKSVTGDGIVFRDYEEDYTDFITMSGVQFDLGSFYNKVNDGITICKTDVAGGSEISGAVLTITRTEGPGQFDVNGITAERTDSNGNITTFTKNTTGTTPADNELLISGSSISYKTNENGNVTIKNLPNGKYTLTETTTPDGYETAEQITFEIAGGNIKNCKDANGNTITMIDRKNVSFKIAKQAAGDATANLAGAKLTLSSVEGYDLTGATVTGCNGEPVKNGSKISVVTTNEALTFSNLPSGRYVLTEDAAPEGFSTQSSIRFKVDSKGVITAIGDLENDQGAITEQGGTYTLAMFDAVLVNIRKQNTQGTELNGAVFQIYKADGQTKVGSSLSVGNYSTALGAGDYILREETAPEGYATAKDIAFSVEVENGVGTVKVGGTALTNNTIVVTDEQGFRIKVFKQYWDRGFSPLEGARMTITASDGSNGNPSWYWTSGTETHVITGLLPGVTYTLTETSAPRGYVKVDPITFTITPKNANDGTCEIVLSQGDSGRLLKSEPYNYASAYNPATDGDLYYTNFYDGELTVYDDTNPDEVGKIVLTKTIKGPVTDEDIKGLTFKVKDENGNAIWTHKLSDSVFTVSTDSNGNKVYTATIDHLNVNKEYTVEETLHTIEGFNVNVTYKVDGASGTGATTGKIKPVEEGTNVDYEDTYTYRGELKVAKALNGIPGHENDDKIFTFKVKVGDTDGYLQADGTIGSSGYEFTVTPAEVCKVPVDSSAFGKKLTVIESDTDREISGFELTSVGYSENNGTVTIDSNTDDKTVTITNSYKKDTKNGSIVLTKTIKGPVTEEDLSTGVKGIVFEIWEEGNTTTPYATLKLGTDFAPSTDGSGNLVYTKTLTGLDTDKMYTVKETKYVVEGYSVTQTYKIGAQSGSGPETEGFKPTINGTAVDFENDYQRIKGELKVTKTLSGYTGTGSSRTFTFYVKAGDQYIQANGTLGTTRYPFTLTTGETCKVPVDYAAFGKALTVEEDTDESNVAITGYDFSGVSYSNNNGTVTVDSATDDETVSITNTYKEQPSKGYITLTKTISGDVTDEDLKGLTFTVKDADGNVIATRKLGDDFEKVPGSGDGTKGTYKLKESELIEVADASKTYTVEETLHTLAGFDVKVTNTIGGTDTAGTTATVTGGVSTDSTKPTEVAYENDYSKKVSKGYITLTKTISGDVTDEDLKGLTFTVKDADGNVIATRKLGDDFEKVPGSGDGTKGTYKLKESELIEVADASKTYTVEETLHTLAGFDVKVTNTIGGTDTAGTTATVTGGVSTDSTKPTEVAYENDYSKKVSKGYITLTKTISGDVTDEDLKGLTFTVKDADGNVIATRKLGDDFEKVPGSGDGTKGTYKLKESELIEVADASKTYTVEETLHTLAGFDVKVTNTIGGTDTAGTTATVTGGVSTDSTKPTEVAYENDYSKKVSKGYITLTKTISGDVTDEDLKGLTFTVKDDEGNVIATLKLGDDFEKVPGSGDGTKGTYKLKDSKLIEVADASKTYTVEETLHTLAGFDVTVTNKIGGGSETTGTTASVTGGVSTDSTKPTEVAYENDYKQQQTTPDKGYITLTKTISGDVTDEDLKGLTFTVKDDEGNVIATLKLGDDFEKVPGSGDGTKGTYKLKDSKLIEVADASKTYTVEETLHTLAGFDVTVTNKIGGGSETTGTTASVTGGVSTDSTKPTEVAYENDYKQQQTTPDKGYITLTKTISGDVTDEDLKGLTFTVKDADGNVIATRKLGDDFEKVTSETGTKGTYQLKADKLIEVADASKTYTVEETLHTLAGFDVKVSNTIGSTSTTGTTATITGGVSTDSTKPTEVAYKNDYVLETGSLTLKKTVNGPDGSTKTTNFTFYVKGEDGKWYDKDGKASGTQVGITVKGNDTTGVKISGIPVQKYDITEADGNAAAADGYELDGSNSDVSKLNVSVDKNQNTTVTLINAYKTKEVDKGSLTLKKTVTGPDGSTKTTNFTFYVKGEDGKWYDKDGKASGTQVGITVKGNDTTGVVISGLPVQKYDITEADGNDAAADGYELDGAGSVISKTDVEVIKNQNTDVTLTNAYKTKDVDSGSLTLKKTVKGPDGSTKTTKFTFYVKGANGKYYDKDGKASTDKVGITVDSSDSNGVKISGLPIQKYDITEADGNAAAADGYELDGANSDISKDDVEVIKDQNTDVTLTNAYKKTEVDSGSLTLKKTVKGPDGSTKTTKFTFYVKGANGKYYDKDGKASTDKVGITVDSSDSNGVKITGLPVQKYDITEADGNAAASDGYELDGANSDISKDDVDVLKDQNTDVTLTNTYKKTEVDTGKLTLSKKLNNAEGCKTTTFTFYVKGADGKWYGADGKPSADKVDIPVTVGTPVTISGLPVQNYTVTEADANKQAKDTYELDGENSVTTRNNISVEKDQTAAAELINTYKKSTVPETGSIKVSKTEAGTVPTSGIPTSYSFYVKCGTEYLKADGTFGDKSDAKAFSVKPGDETEVTGLELGKTYTIEEASYNVPDGYTVSVTYSSSKSVTLDSTNKSDSVKITNTYISKGAPLAGSLVVTKRLAGSVPSSGMPDSYKFYVKCGDLFVQNDGSLGENKHLFTITPNKSLTIIGLDTDNKTYQVVEEPVSNSDLPDGYKWSVVYSSESVTLKDPSDSGEIEITNNYTHKAPTPTEDKGSLALKKTVSGPSGCTNTSSFTFYVKGADKKWYDKNGTAHADKVEITVKDGETVTISGLPVQTYTVTEKNPADTAADGYEIDGNKSVPTRVNVEVVKDGTAEAELINAYKKSVVDTGSLTLKKTVKGPDGSTKTTNFTFYVKGADGKYYDKDGKASSTKTGVTVSSTDTDGVKITGIPVQTYDITEADGNDAAADGFELDGANSDVFKNDVDVTKDNNTTVTLINAYKKSVVDTGSLTLKKTVKGPDGSTKTTEFTFYVKGADGNWYDKDGKASSTKVGVTVKSTDTDGVKITGIPVQKYDITEADGNDAAADGYELDGANSDVFKNDVEVNKDTNTTVTLINAYKTKTVQETGSIILKKTVSGDTGCTKTTEFTFYVKGADGKWYDKDGNASSTKVGVTVSSTDTDGVKISGIPVQKYDITEDTDNTAADNYDFDGANSEISKTDVEVTKDVTPTVTLVNAYKKASAPEKGDLVLKKTVNGPTGYTTSKTFKFYVKGEDGKWYDKDGKASSTQVAVEVGANKEVTIKDIPVQKYDITEDTNNTAEDGYELDTANSTTSRTGVSVTSTKPGEAELINAYKTKTVVPEFGNLSFTKTFSGDVLENEVLTSDMYFVIERTDITAAAKYLKKDGTFTSDATAARIKLTELAHNSGSLVWSLDIANVPVGTYKITEYNTTIKVDGSNVTFILDTGSVTSGTANVAKSSTGKTALVNKYNLPGYDVKISKQDIAKNELPKATLTLTSKDGYDLSGAVVKQGSKTIKITVSADKKSISFVTGTTPSVVSGLKPGTYELKETVTPEAYLTADAITFTIERNGTIRDDKGTVIVTGSPIVMIDRADPNYKKHKSVPATGVGTSPANVIGSIVLAIGAACCAGLVIYVIRKKKYL